MGAVSEATMRATMEKDAETLKAKIADEHEQAKTALAAQAAEAAVETPGFGALSVAALMTVILKDQAELSKMLHKDRNDMQKASREFDAEQKKGKELSSGMGDGFGNAEEASDDDNAF